MIEKMKFLSITGPKADIDRVVDQYLSKYEIHLENALSELKTVAQLRPYIEINPYREWLQKADELINALSDKDPSPPKASLHDAHRPSAPPGTGSRAPESHGLSDHYPAVPGFQLQCP